MYSLMLVNIINYVGLCEILEESSIQVMSFFNENYFSIIHKYAIQNKAKIGDIIADKQFLIWNKKYFLSRSCDLSIKTAIKIKNDLIIQNNKIPKQFNFKTTISIISEKDKLNLIHSNKLFYLNETCKIFGNDILIDEITYNNISNKDNFGLLNCNNDDKLKYKVYYIRKDAALDIT